LQHSFWLYLLAGTAGLMSGLMAAAKLRG
jgi:hypothetical protein